MRRSRRSPCEGPLRACQARGPGWRVVVAAAALALLTSCQVWTPTFDGSGGTRQKAAVLTPDGEDHYSFNGAQDWMDVSAPGSNSGSNHRGVFWPAGAPVVADSESCATWTSQDGPITQQGAALRIRETSGRVRALTVTKNIWFGAAWIFNSHTWDPDRPDVFHQFGQAKVPGIVADKGVMPLPWRFCARVQGSNISFKVWPTKMAEPAWGDARWGGSATIPAGWEKPGTTGWYIGHLSPGTTARFDRLRTSSWGAPTPKASGSLVVAEGS